MPIPEASSESEISIPSLETSDPPQSEKPVSSDEAGAPEVPLDVQETSAEVPQDAQAPSILDSRALGVAPDNRATDALGELSPAQVEPNLPGLANPNDLTVHLRSGAEITDKEISDAEGTFQAIGIPVETSIRVNYTISSNQVRFFHRRDSEPAGALAELLGATARDFTSYRPQPPVGMIEVFLTDPVKPFVPQVPLGGQRPPTSPSGEQAELLELRDRVILRLQSGDRLPTD